MPVLGPGGVQQFLISDLANEVIVKVENRLQDVSRAYIWLRDAILDIASNPDYRDDFAELEVNGPPFNLSPGVQEYDEFNIVQAGDICDATLDIFLWSDPPTNKLRRKLDFTSFQDADTATNISPGLPTQWYRFGGAIGFVLKPNLAYQVQSRVLRQHPINDTEPQLTPILLPRDWHMILVHAAAEIGFIELLEYEKAAQIHQLLHGDPLHPEKPGLIYGRKKKRKRENWRTQGALRPVVRGYGYGRDY